MNEEPRVVSFPTDAAYHAALRSAAVEHALRSVASLSMRGAIHDAVRYALAAAPVLILGETGAGKEWLVELMHKVAVGSPQTRPMLNRINLNAVPADLLESTLFGHRKGAFTGATRDQVGLFQIADGGWLLLDEIDKLTKACQGKILQVIETGRFRPLGDDSGQERRVSVRVIATANRDLAQLAGREEFLWDLAFRLNVLVLKVPPLRQRREDIEALCDGILQQKRPEKRLSRGARTALADHSLPGNVRQLLAIINRGYVRAGAEPEITVRDLQLELEPTASAQSASSPSGESFDQRLEAFIVGAITQALSLSGGNRSQAAKTLQMSSRRLNKLCDDLGI